MCLSKVHSVEELWLNWIFLNPGLEKLFNFFSKRTIDICHCLIQKIFFKFRTHLHTFRIIFFTDFFLKRFTNFDRDTFFRANFAQIYGEFLSKNNSLEECYSVSILNSPSIIKLRVNYKFLRGKGKLCSTNSLGIAF